MYTGEIHFKQNQLKIIYHRKKIVKNKIGVTKLVASRHPKKKKIDSIIFYDYKCGPKLMERSNIDKHAACQFC